MTIQRSCGAIAIFTLKCASCHSHVHFFCFNSKKCSETVSFNTFDFSTSKFQKCSASEVLFNILTSTCASCHNGLRQMAPHPPLYRACFSNPPEPRNIGKNTVFRNFSTFSHTLIFFLRTLSLLCLFPPLLLHLSILSEVWLLILRSNIWMYMHMNIHIYIYIIYICV